MSSIVFLVLGRGGSSTCGGAGWEECVVVSVSTGGTDSLMVVVDCFETAPVLGLSATVARECWDILNPIRVTGEWLGKGLVQFARK